MAKRSGKKGAPALKAIFYVGLVLLVIGAAYSIYDVTKYPATDITAPPEVWFTVILSLLFSFAVISYLLSRGKKGKEIIKELGLSRKALNARTVGYGMLLFGTYIAILLAIAAFSLITGIAVSSNVQQTIGTYPIWALVFISIVAPFNEEIAFRGFLVPRIGIILSGLLFAILHFGYGSISEIAVALWFGLMGGYIFKKTRSLYPTLITHILVNSVTSIALVYSMQMMFALIH